MRSIRHCPKGRVFLLLAVLVLLSSAWDALARSGRFDELFYETSGKGEAIVFLHGGKMDRRMWDAQFEIFAKDYQVVRYDLRGFVKSRSPLKPSSPVKDLRALLDHPKFQRGTPMETPSEFNALAREFLAGFEREAK